jgi:cyanate permease
MSKSDLRVYPVRWVMLALYMLLIASNQLLWITFAPVTGNASSYYGVSDLSIGILSMCFMIVYIVVSIPASWIIDKYGIRAGIGIGAIFTGVFGMMRGYAGTDYNFLLAMQVGIAVGQPFILNAITKFAARWFPLEERATAVGLGSLAMYIGILGGMVLTPYMVIRSGMNGMLNLYGLISALIAAAFIILVRERPPTAPCPPDQEERSLVYDGFVQTLRTRDFIWLMVIFFIGLGVFNSVATWIEDIMRPRGFTATQAGLTGGMMIMGGIVGALIIPMLSDRIKKRTPFIIVALFGATLGLAGLTFATSYWLLITSGLVMGFFLLSAGPVGFQYGAEITFPASEGTSNGMLLMMGQISGIAFIFAMDSLKSPINGSMTTSLVLLIALMILGIIMSFTLKESIILKKDADI